MRETCQIRADRRAFRGLWHKWRFVAYLDGPEGEEVVGHTGEFWGPSFKLDSSTTGAKNALRDLLRLPPHLEVTWTCLGTEPNPWTVRDGLHGAVVASLHGRVN